MTERRKLRKFPGEWFSSEEFIPQGGAEPREEGFNRPAHAQNLIAGVRQAYLSKPEKPLYPDGHVFFAARTWKDRPSLRKNLDQINAKIHRVLPDGAVVASWSSKVVYEQTKNYISQYSMKDTKSSDMDFVESIKGLDYRDKLGRSLLAILESGDHEKEGLLEFVYYPDYSEHQIKEITATIKKEFSKKRLVLKKLLSGHGRNSSVWTGPLYLCEEIAKRTEQIAIIEQVGELRPAANQKLQETKTKNLKVVKPFNLPQVGILDTGVQAGHPLLAGLILSGNAKLDHVDSYNGGGHGTFVGGVVVYGDDPFSQVQNGQITARALIHPRKVELTDSPGGINLLDYQQLAAVVDSLRAHTRVFTASFSSHFPIDSDNIGALALNIDLISRKYGVLFVLPTGNLPNLLPSGYSSPVQPNYNDPTQWFSDTNAQMGRPGEAFNALTVSSYAETQVGNEISTPGHATIYSRRGPGPKAMPKPDLCEAGGNCVLLMDQDDPTQMEFQSENHPNAALTNLQSPKGVMKNFGTSFAVPKVAFALGKLVKTFEGLGQNSHAPILAKAYLIHIAKCPESPGPFPVAWNEADKKQNQHLLYGYGVPEKEALDGVLPSELCFYYGGEISRRQRHTFRLNFPANLINSFPDVRLRVTLTYFTKVDPTSLDAELYSLVELSPLVRWGGKTLPKVSRGAPLTDFYPIKTFDVRFARPREGEPFDRGQPTVEVTMRDRVLSEDDFHQKYAIIISLVSATGELLLNDLVHEIEDE